MMMKKSWKNRSAVSPVIATILMVAITVVLAAVLYVMVMGFGNNSATAPSATMSKDTGAAKIFVSISNPTAITDFKVAVNGAAATNVNATGFTFVDVGGDNKVTTGDYWTVADTVASGTTLSLIYISGGASTSLATITW